MCFFPVAQGHSDYQMINSRPIGSVWLKNAKVKSGLRSCEAESEMNCHAGKFLALVVCGGVAGKFLTVAAELDWIVFGNAPWTQNLQTLRARWFFFGFLLVFDCWACDFRLTR